jgi:hypothetical protein
VSEQASEVTAAATGAAAAVAAVQDDNAEAERAAHVEAVAADAAIDAEVAAERAESAAQAAQDATSAAVDATEVAQQAAGTAAVAAETAYSVQDDIQSLRSEVRDGWQNLRAHLDETFGSKQTDQPTEVVVTHERTDTGNAETGTTDAGGNSAPSGGTERTRRHRFGHG